MRKRYSISLCLCLLLSACMPSKKEGKPLIRADYPDAAETKLAEAATSVSHSLEKLAEIEAANNPTARLPAPPNPGQIGMAQLVSIDWTGPAKPLIEKIAQISHYRLRVLGSEPAIPAIVSITAKDKLLADALRDIQFQIQKQARINIYTQSRVIELRYLKV